jgi:hypothetical protein
MPKKKNQFTPITDAFKEKLIEAVKSENQGKEIKKAVDEFVVEMGAAVKKLNNQGK